MEAHTQRPHMALENQAVPFVIPRMTMEVRPCDLSWRIARLGLAFNPPVRGSLERYHPDTQRIAGAVEPSLVRRYEKLRATRKGVALAAVSKDGSCMACRLHIEPQIVAEVKRADNILTCSYCQRILYWTGGVLVSGGQSTT